MVTSSMNCVTSTMIIWSLQDDGKVIRARAYPTILLFFHICAVSKPITVGGMYTWSQLTKMPW